MSPHKTQPIEIRPGRRARRQAEKRKRLRQHLMASVAITFLAAMLVLFFAQSPEPPLVEATLPDRPEEEVVNDEGLELDREQVLAPVAAERLSRGAQTPPERLSRPGEGGSTGQPAPSISAIPAPPVGEPPRTPAGGSAEVGEIQTPDPVGDIDDDPPPPPTTTSPPVAVDDELTRPPIDPIVDPVCPTGRRYDPDRRECVSDEDPEPAERDEDGEEAAEEKEQPSRSDLGGVTKGRGSVIERDIDDER